MTTKHGLPSWLIVWGSLVMTSAIARAEPWELGNSRRAGRSTEQAIATAARRASRSVVQVHNNRGGSGSGFFYRSAQDPSKVLIMTNHHVVRTDKPHKTAGEIATIGFASGAKPIRALVLGASARADIAVLEPLEPLPENIRPLPIRQDPLKTGEQIVTVGHPYGGDLTGISPHVTFGHVARAVPGECPAITAKGAPGNSGGPALDRHGRVVGLVSRGVGGQGGDVFGVLEPVEKIARVLTRIEKGDVRHATTGAIFQPMNGMQGAWEGLRTDMARVGDVLAGSPAHRAGLREGDVVASITVRSPSARSAPASAQLSLDEATSPAKRSARATPATSQRRQRVEAQRLVNPTVGQLALEELSLEPGERVRLQVLRSTQRRMQDGRKQKTLTAWVPELKANDGQVPAEHRLVTVELSAAKTSQLRGRGIVESKWQERGRKVNLKTHTPPVQQTLSP